jgi:glycosyltransferase involved in cell wall biosynthesis
MPSLKEPRSARAEAIPRLETRPLTVFINAANAAGIGGAAVVRHLIPAIARVTPHFHFEGVVPDLLMYHEMRVPENVRLHFWRRRGGLANDAARLRQLHWDIPRSVRRARADVCLTLGDVGPIKLPCPHVTFVHVAHLAYPTKALAGRDAWSPLKRRYLEWHFRRSAGHGSHFIVQTPLMAQGIAAMHGVAAERISCIGQPPPVDRTAAVREHQRLPEIERSGKRIRLLFMASYVAHKNHAILPDVIDELRHRGLTSDIGFFVTIDPLDAAVSMKLRLPENRDVLFNLGRLSSLQVQAAYRSCTALFLPTLIESYGLPYLEALAFGKPILTSDREFARWMCRDLATYFDPLDPISIADAVQQLAERGVDTNFVQRAQNRLAEFPPDWDTAALAFADVIRKVAS